jgi:hypothetical protein
MSEMKKMKFCLVAVCDREIGTPQFFATREEAYDAMCEDFARCMGVSVESAKNDFMAEDSVASCQKDCAWLEGRGGQIDWKIFELDSENIACSLARTRKECGRMNEILDEIQNGRVHVGDKIGFKLLDGSNIHMVVADMTASEVRLDSLEVVPGSTTFATMDSFLDEIETLIPDELLSRLRVTSREHMTSDGKRYQERRKIFIPAAPEIFPSEMAMGDRGLYRQLDWYKSPQNRVKTGSDGAPRWYWTGSHCKSQELAICSVSTTGYACKGFQHSGDYGSVAIACILPLRKQGKEG